ncbi:MAG: glycosyltransferase family 39 protein [Anaerolineales bacterium]|nr:glycosyltransferase family 39 protein [Anaerolineales bacterium]
MSRSDCVALLLSLLAVLAGYLVHDRVFERLAHIEDEMAYVWQAQVIEGGRLRLPSPPEPKSFLYPFVVDYGGQRFGKYPLGWPVLLAVGEILGARFLVNPLLGGLGVWLTYRLGKRLFGAAVGLLAAGLTLTSPFFLMNSGSLLSHPFGLVLSAAFALAWLDGFCQPKPARAWLAALAAGASLGALILTRPMTALGLAAPFGLHGLYLLARGDWAVRRRLLALGAIALALTSMHFLWQYALTGDALLNPYTLWWPYDKVGFGPGAGRAEGGHTLHQAWINTRHSLRAGRYDLFGWGSFSWIFLPVGLLAALKDRNGRTLLLSSVFPSLVIVYLAYWIGSSLFGPRYFYEALYSLTLLSAAGVALLAGWPTRPGDAFPQARGWRRARALAVASLLALLVAANLAFYTPMRLGHMFGLYGVQRSHMQPFLAPETQKFAPALVIVHTKSKWIEYGTLLELETPFLDTPFIFVISRNPEANAAVIAHFPERHVYHYYPVDEPYVLYTAPRPPQSPAPSE